MSRFEAGVVHSPTAKRESRTVFVHPAVSSLSPNNPAGIESLLRVVHGDIGYSALNDEFFLGWALRRDVLAEIVEEHQGNSRFQKNLQAFGLDRERVATVIETAEEAREATRQFATYTDFERFRWCKRVLEDAVKIISAPFIISDEEREEVIIKHNTIDYYNSAYKDSRKRLLTLAPSAALFRNYLERDAVPHVLEGDPSFVVVSVTHPDQHVFAFQLAHHIRQTSPETVIIFGGNTISRRIDNWSQNDETNRAIFRRGKDEKSGIIDGLINSEGELALSELTLRMVEDPSIDLQRLFADMPGVVYNRDGRIVANALPSDFKPEAFWRRDDVYKLLTEGFMPDNQSVQSLVDGRICVFECQTGGCAFCSISKGYLEKARETVESLGIPMEAVTPRQVTTIVPSKEIGKRGSVIIQQRRLGTDRMAEEIAAGHKEGFTVVDITDEQFTLHQALELADALASRGLNTGKVPDVTYSCYMRIDGTGDTTDYRGKYGAPLAELLIDPQIAARVARGGMRFAQFGLETTAPWKMAAMEKGTTADKVKRFRTILRNLAENDIMTHVFIIVGAPLDEHFWDDRKKIAVEESILRREATANDLEILEAIYNLKFLAELRDYIFTMKHTQYKLSFGAPHARQPKAYGLRVREQSASVHDTSVNIPFAYKKNHGPTDRVLKDLIDMYDLWKEKELPYQPVTEEYLYHQRLIVGAEGIRETAARLFPLDKRELSEDEQVNKRNILNRMWIQLVGGNEGMRLLANAKKQPDNQKLQDRVNANLFVREFPEGFADWSDLYRAADLLEVERRKELRKTS